MSLKVEFRSGLIMIQLKWGIWKVDTMNFLETDSTTHDYASTIICVCYASNIVKQKVKHYLESFFNLVLKVES